jgi:hypothetical protein
MVMDYSFYRTLWRGSWRKRLPPPPGVYLLPISSWYVAGPSRYLIVPTLPEGLRYAVDSGAYRYTCSSGHYPFDFSDYLAWCQTLDPAPIWVAIPDWSGGRTAPEPTWQSVTSHFHFLAALYSAKFQRLEITHVQQIRTALMAYAVWDHFRSAVPCWVPVLQGGKTAADYVWHARLMQPLIEEMAAYYGPESPFRVGIGGLVGKSASAVLEIVAAIAAVLPGFTFHLFGWKLRALQEMPAAFPKCIAGLSSDSSQWNGQRVRGKTPGKKAWQESGLTQLAYAYCMALPSYEARLMEAWKRLQSLPSFPVPALDEDPSLLERLRVFLRMRVFLNAQFRDSPFDLVDIRPAEEDEEDEEGLPPPDITDLSTVYEIYHAIGPQARFRQASDLWHRERKSFRLVALVRAPLDQLFERTNSIDSLWTENVEVVWCRSARLRSSSVGDVFVSCESGKAWMVAHAGFLDLSHTLDAGAVAEVSGVVLCDDLSSTSLELTEKPT